MGALEIDFRNEHMDTLDGLKPVEAKSIDKPYTQKILIDWLHTEDMVAYLKLRV